MKLSKPSLNAMGEMAGHNEESLHWGGRTIVEQLAHVGSEVERTFRAQEMGHETRFENAFARALQLFDVTANDARWRGHRRREVLRAREEFCRLVLDGDETTGSRSGLRRYFFAFAVAAQRQAGR